MAVTATCGRCGTQIDSESSPAGLCPACLLIAALEPSPPTDTPDVMIGQAVHHYTITESLGQGGMGVVYRATDSKLRRAVALKFLPEGVMEDPQARARFMREAQAASTLDHPNVATIHEIGEWDDQLYIAMACYEGETLKQRLVRRALDFEDVESILSQVAAGLVAAHDAGIVHRDLKPANVMLTRDGQVKILDFGVAKIAARGDSGGNETTVSQLTETGTTVGTVGYMSPEQVQGKVVDQRSDLWSLGVMAYEMLTRLRPFDTGTSLGTAGRILGSEPQPLAGARPDTPPHLVTLVERLLVKDREARIPTAAAVLSALEGRTKPVRPIEVPTRAWTNRLVDRRLRLAAGVAAVALVAAIAASTLPLSFSTRPEPIAGVSSVLALPASVFGAEEYLEDAVPNIISTALAQVDGLETRVPPSSSDVDRVRGDLVRIADAYGVTHFIHSSVTSTADGLVLSVQVAEPRSRDILWSADYEGAVGGALPLARQAADQLAAMLGGGVSLAAGADLNPLTEAEQLLRRGDFYTNRYNSLHRPGDFEYALEALQRALDLDPQLADAAGALAALHFFKIESGTGSVPELIPEVDRWARRALAIDAESSTGWAMLSNIEQGSPQGTTERALEYALKGARYAGRDVRGHAALAHVMSGVSIALDMAASRYVGQIDPLYLHAQVFLADDYRHLGSYTEALSTIEPILETEPDFAPGLHLKSLILLELDRVTEAAELVTQIREFAAEGGLDPIYATLSELALALARGDTEAAEGILAPVLELVDVSTTDVHTLGVVFTRAVPLLARYGNLETALHILTRSAAAGALPTYEWLMLNPRLEPLRSDARFNEILTRARARFDEMVAVMETARSEGFFPEYLEQPLADLLVSAGA